MLAKLCFTFALIAAATANADEARVLSTLGGVRIDRGDQSQTARERMVLQSGDRLTTVDSSAASLLLSRSVAYLAANTSLSLEDDGPQRTLHVSRGRVRIVVTDDTGLRLQTPTSRATLSRGVYQVAVDDSQTLLANLAGRAIVAGMAQNQLRQPAPIQASYQAGASRTVNPGESIAVPPSGPAAPTHDAPVSADEEARRRKALQEDAADAAEEQQLTQQQQNELRDEDIPPSSRGGQGSGSLAPAFNNVATPAISSSFGGLSSGPSFAFGGLFADAAQSTNQGQIDTFPPGGPVSSGPFAGNIHLLTAESRYAINGVALTQSEKNAIFPEAGNTPVYFSIGAGPLPNSQVFTDFLTASEVAPTAVAIPGFNAYVLKFTQFGLIDSGLQPDAAEQNVQGVNGLVGVDPPAPSIFNATPTADERAKLNELATFALGEFRLRLDGGDTQNLFELAVRRSDQDRLIVKDGGGNDANDLVTPNPDVGTFNDVADPRFQPAAATVKVPVAGTFNGASTHFSQLNDLRRAAATTILADQLHDFAQRTGQTRFVFDGRIIDISGYKK